MSEERAPLSPEERAEQIRLAKERAAAARAAREGGGQPQAAAATPSPVASEPEPTVALPVAQAEAADPGDRAAAIQAAKERAAAARAARESGAAAPAPVTAQAASAPAAASTAAPQPAARAEPASPADRAAAIQAAKERAAAARAAREGNGAAASAPAAPAPKPALSPEQRAAALAQAQERAAALKAQRAAAAPAVATPVAPAGPVPTWRVAPAGKGGQILAARPDPRAQALAQTDPAARMVLRRRDFLRGGFWGGLAVLVVGSLAAFTDFFNPRDVRGFGGVITIPAKDVPAAGGDPVHDLEAKTWVSHLKAGEGVVNGIGAPGPTGVLALYHKCPHLGCTVPWRSDFQFLNHTGWFRCPCHGSTYTKAGYRVFGPAPHSMWTFPVKVLKGGALSVDTGKVSNGNLTQAKTTVPYP